MRLFKLRSDQLSSDREVFRYRFECEFQVDRQICKRKKLTRLIRAVSFCFQTTISLFLANNFTSFFVEEVRFVKVEC